MHTNAISKSHNSKKTPFEQSTPISSAPTQFGLTGYSCAHTYAMAAFHSIPSQISQDTPHMPNPVLAPSSTNVPGNHSSYRMLPPQPASTFVPVMYWPPPNAFLHGPYPSTYGYQSFPSTANYMPFHTQPYYNHPTCSSSLPKLSEGSGKNDLASEESDSASDSSSGGTEQKQWPALHK